MKTTFIHSLHNAILVTALAAQVAACDEEGAQDLGPTLVEPSDANAMTPEALGLGPDWIEVEPGLWALYDEAGDRKLLGLGEAGKAHALASLVEVEAELERSLAESDSPELRDSLAELRGFITEVDATVADDPAASPTLRCSFNVSGAADAYPIACGAAATASASYAHPCGAAAGTVKTFASAACGYQTKTHQCGPYAADPAACSSSASITGAGPCNSYSMAQITGSGINVHIWDSNGQRGACGGNSTTSNTSNTTNNDSCPGYNVECIPH